MSSISRREFFQKTAGTAAALSLVAAQVAKLKANPLGLPIGSQTFPFRSRIQAGDLAGLLKEMKGIGIDMTQTCRRATLTQPSISGCARGCASTPCSGSI